MVSNCADLTLSIFLYLTVRSPIWPYNYRLWNIQTLTGQFAFRWKTNSRSLKTWTGQLSD